MNNKNRSWNFEGIARRVQAMWLALEARGLSGICHHLGVSISYEGINIGLSPAAGSVNKRWHGRLLVMLYPDPIVKGWTGRDVADAKRAVLRLMGWRCVCHWNGGGSFVVSAMCPRSLRKAIWRYHAMNDVFAPNESERLLLALFLARFQRRVVRYLKGGAA